MEPTGYVLLVAAAITVGLIILIKNRGQGSGPPPTPPDYPHWVLDEVIDKRVGAPFPEIPICDVTEGDGCDISQGDTIKRCQFESAGSVWNYAIFRCDDGGSEE